MPYRYIKFSGNKADMYVYAMWERAALVLVVGCLVAACAAANSSVTLPQKPSPHPTSTPHRAHHLTARQQVLREYFGYTAALVRADDTGNATAATKILASWIPKQQIPNAIRAFAQLWRRHEITYGVPISHIVSVTVHGNTAAVRDCENTQQSGLKDTRTGKAVPGTQGTSAHLDMYTTLKRVGGHWWIDRQLTLDVPCTASI